jgi:hypothetical protein
MRRGPSGFRGLTEGARALRELAGFEVTAAHLRRLLALLPPAALSVRWSAGGREPPGLEVRVAADRDRGALLAALRLHDAALPLPEAELPPAPAPRAPVDRRPAPLAGHVPLSALYAARAAPVVPDAAPVVPDALDPVERAALVARSGLRPELASTLSTRALEALVRNAERGRAATETAARGRARELAATLAMLHGVFERGGSRQRPVAEVVADLRRLLASRGEFGSPEELGARLAALARVEPRCVRLSTVDGERVLFLPRLAAAELDRVRARLLEAEAAP